MEQIVRTLTMDEDGPMNAPHVLRSGSEVER
jgi:hypothetical protein